MFFKDRVLITGGTGTIGRELVRQLLYWDVIIFSRNEKDQVSMKQEYPSCKYVLGDVRDYSEILNASRNVEYVFHLAAIKHVEICENQPQEAVKTNIIGTLNVINACKENKCKLINMSSDKAINPTNVYGKTKSLAEDMATQAGFLSIRSGNVLWSSGSVLEFWKKQIEITNSISVTSSEMTRFFINVSELVDFIWNNRDKRGMVTVPMKSFRLYDIAKEFINHYGNSKTKINITGLRSGERLHEYRDENISSNLYLCDDLSYIFK